MSAETNLDLVIRMYEALNAQDLEAHNEFWHEDMIWHGPPGFGDVHGLEAFKYEVLQPFYRHSPIITSRMIFRWLMRTGCRQQGS